MMSMSLSRCKAVAIKHTPEIAIAVGIVGFIATVVTAVKSTPKAMERIEEAKRKIIEEKNLEEDAEVKLTPIQVVKAAGPCYIIPAITGTLSIASIIFSNRVSAGRIAGLTSTCSILSEGFREYKAKVREVIGEKKEAKIREEIDTAKMAKTAIPAAKIGEFHPSNGLYPCFDCLTGDYFMSNKTILETVKNDLNYRFTEPGGYEEWIPVNDYRREVSLAEVDVGEILGWNIEDGPITFYYGSTNMPDGTPALSVSFDHSTREGAGVKKRRPCSYY